MHVSRSKMTLEFIVFPLTSTLFSEFTLVPTSTIHIYAPYSLFAVSCVHCLPPAVRSTHGGHCHESKGKKAGKGEPSAGETMTDNIMYTKGIEPISLYAGQKNVGVK